MSSKVTVECTNCGTEWKEYKSVNEYQKKYKNRFCSRECRVEYYLNGKEPHNKNRKIVYCDNCGKEIERSPSHIAENNFCSEECYGEFMKGKKPDNYSKIEKECKECGKKFKVSPSLSRIKFCSPECYHKNRTITPQEKICKNCGEIFKPHRGYGEQRFCSVSCVLKYSGETSIEKKFRNELEKRSINFEQNYQVGRFVVDFLVEPNIAVECDGTYWHSNRKDVDDRKDGALRGIDLVVLRYDEKEINDNVKSCVDEIQKMI